MQNQETVNMTVLLKVGDRKALADLDRALKAAGGKAEQAAAELGISHRTFCRWLNTIPAVAAAAEKVRAAAAKAPRARREPAAGKAPPRGGKAKQAGAAVG